MPVRAKRRRVPLGADSPGPDTAEREVRVPIQPARKAPETEPEPGPATPPTSKAEAEPVGPPAPKADTEKLPAPKPPASRGRRLVGWLAWLCAAVLIGAVVAAWAEPRPDLTQEDARIFARQALEEAGFDDVEVAPAVASGTDQPEGPDGEVLDVWVTAVTVETGTIALWVHQEEAQATRAYGNGPDGTQLLTTRQYSILDDYTRDPALERRYRRNYAVTAAGGLGALVGLVLGARQRKRTSVR